MDKAQSESKKTQKALYVYCIGNSSKPISLGNIGLENKEVHTVSYKDLCAVVHECEAEPYNSQDAETIRGWIKTHQAVVEKATEFFENVLPMTFDMIIKGEGEDPSKRVANWLKTEYGNLKAKLDKLKDRQEFGVQIFWDKNSASEKIADENEQVKELKNSSENEARGKAYFTEQKVKNLIKTELEQEADNHFKTFYKQIEACADDIKVDKVKKTKGEKEMLANFSCLVQERKVSELGAELDKINELEGFSVKFTGPWPPYSFVSIQDD